MTAHDRAHDEPTARDLVQQLAEILARAAWDKIQDEEMSREPTTVEYEPIPFSRDELGNSYYDSRVRDQRPAARAVLASGLVVPTSDVLDLAQQWDDVRELSMGCDQAATELRALTQQEAG